MTEDVRIERTLGAAPATVYAARTDPAVLTRWYCPNPDLPVEVTADAAGRAAGHAEGWELSLTRLGAEVQRTAGPSR